VSDLLHSTASGLYCPAGDFYVDPWRPVRHAVITHAHSDHATRGSQHYLAAREGSMILQARLGADARVQPVAYGEQVSLGDVTLSLHPAGHILGSAQVRIERGGEVWVVTGDYKTANDPTCSSFEPVTCHTLVTESTFGLPIYRWDAPDVTFSQVNAWWQANSEAGIASVLFAYSVGKSQRLISGLDATIGPIYCHGTVERMNQLYRQSGVALPETRHAGALGERRSWRGAMVIAPLSARGSAWMRRFGEHSTAFASGWMRIRGARRRRSIDRGFVLSDHADWPALLAVIRSSGAERVLVTHGAVDPLVRWLNENYGPAAPLPTPYHGELDETAEAETTSSEPEDENESNSAEEP
jgi:putative mRNA 3-end processing factor